MKDLNYYKLAWLLAITETLHNLEEAIWMPEFSHTVSQWRAPVSPFQFRLSVVILTLLFYCIIFYFSRYRTAFSKYLFGGLLVVILFNVFVPHLVAAIYLWRYMPGMVTGVLLNLPVTVYLIRRGLSEGIFTTRSLISGTLLVAVFVLPVMLILA